MTRIRYMLVALVISLGVTIPAAAALDPVSECIGCVAAACNVCQKGPSPACTACVSKQCDICDTVANKDVQEFGDKLAADKAARPAQEQQYCLDAERTLVATVQGGLKKLATPPATLDNARNGPGGEKNGFFANAIPNTINGGGITDRTWSKNGNIYTHTCGIQKNIYRYDAKSGIFGK